LCIQREVGDFLPLAAISDSEAHRPPPFWIVSLAGIYLSMTIEKFNIYAAPQEGVRAPKI
jgi:hypothetical protein